MSLTRSVPVEAVYVGDLMKISVELIRAIAEQPNFTTHLVRLRQIRLEPDGTKVLVMDVVER